MRVAFKKFAVMFFLAVVVAAIAVPSLPAFAIAPSHAAGCHGHSPKTPAPVSYSCCQTGHGAALVQASSMFQPLVFVSSNTLNSNSYGLTPSFVGVRYQINPSSSPPGNFPRRI
jgi:hypothetical protein